MIGIGLGSETAFGHPNMHPAHPNLVSAVVVSWNSKAFLIECLESLTDSAAQPSLEVIVVDNGSTDGSQAAVRERFPGVVLIDNGENLGFARATNLGIRHSHGDYVMFVNSDTRVFPGCIEALLEFMNTHPDVGMASPRIVGRDGRSQHVVGRGPSLRSVFRDALGFQEPRCPCCEGPEHDSDAGQMVEVELIMLCFTIVRRQAMEKVGLLDEAFFFYGEDVDFSKRFRDHGWRLAFVPGPRAFHYGGGSSERAPVRFYIELLRARIQYFRKHGGLRAALACRCILVMHMVLRLAGYGPKALLGAQVADETTRLKAARSMAALQWLVTGRAPLWARAAP